MRIGAFKLENTFLTVSGEVGQQWVNVYTGALVSFWTERSGVLRNSSTTIVHVDTYGRMLSVYQKAQARHAARHVA